MRRFADIYTENLTLRDEFKITNDKQDYRQPLGGYHRVVENFLEKVDYLHNHTLRVWNNTENTAFSTHWHVATEIIMPLEGPYTITFSEYCVTLQQGEILIIPPGELHGIEAPKYGSRIIALFDLSMLLKLQGFSHILPILTQPLLLTKESCPETIDALQTILLRIRGEYFRADNLFELAIYSMLLDFFVEIGRHHIENIAVRPYIDGSKQRNFIEKINTAIAYMEQHFTENMSLELVAEKAGFSKYHFTRIFQEYFGQNFSDYLCRLRIQHAERLLADESCSVTEAAAASGFGNISTFNRTFKKLKHCNPAEYRTLYISKP